MKKVVIAVVVVLVVVVALAGRWYLRLRAEAAKWSAPVQEIAEESVTHDGPVTKSRFVSLIDAPPDRVENAVWNVEGSQGSVPNVKLSKLLESTANTKLLEMNIQALQLPPIAYTMEFTRHPGEHRITFKTIKSGAQDIEGEYMFQPSPDGTRTRMTYTTVSRDKIGGPISKEIMDAANKETYVNTVRGINKSLGKG
jgi:hypothetical protein